MPISWCKYSNTVLKNKIFLSKNDIIPFSSGNRFRGAIEERTKEHTRERTGPRQVGPRQIDRESEKRDPNAKTHPGTQGFVRRKDASGCGRVRPDDRDFIPMRENRPQPDSSPEAGPPIRPR